MRPVRSVVVASPSCCSCPACAGTARGAGDGKPLLHRGIELYREASYAESVAMLEHARARGGLEPPERVECAFYLAAGYVALNSPGAARRELRAVLHAEPDYELPQYTSPKVAALFRDVRDGAGERAAADAAAAGAARRRARLLRFEAVAHRRAARTAACSGAGAATSAGARRRCATTATTLVADVPVERTGALEYFADGRAPNGALPAGSARAAARAAGRHRADAVARRRRVAWRTGATSKARKLWWLWTGLAVVGAAGAGVGLYFALRPQPSPTANAVFDFQVH